MLNIKTKDIKDKAGKRIAVQIRARDYDKIMELMEDYVLAQFIKASENDTPLSKDEARKYYDKLQKVD